MTDCICQHRYQDSEYVRPCRCNLWSNVIRQCFCEECGLSKHDISRVRLRPHAPGSRGPIENLAFVRGHPEPSVSRKSSVRVWV